ncbi:MAG: esterase/lipase family protein [Verrucomicrobiia bacterium]
MKVAHTQPFRVAGVWNALALLLSAVLVAGCSTPIRARKTSVRHVQNQLERSVLNGKECSGSTRAVLRRYDLEQAFRNDPEAVLKQLHEIVLVDQREDLLLAVAELNYFQAERLRSSVKSGERPKARDYFLASSIYAYFYLSGHTTEADPIPFDPRPLLALDLYNRALAQGLAAPASTNAVVLLHPEIRPLLIGPVTVGLRTKAFPWPLPQVAEFVMADAYSVRGLSVRNRQPGFGAPLIATMVRPPGGRPPPRTAVTVLLRVEGDLREWSVRGLNGFLEVYPGAVNTRIEVAGRTVPLQTDITAPLALSLSDPAWWKLGRRQFFSSREIVKSDIYRPQLYQPGTVPVVFVHGTLSSPVCWAEMWNVLASDPVLSQRCQFWAFVYNTGNPIVWSAANLRDALSATVHSLDPGGADAALRQMVVIGHSQGGLLAKLTVTRTEDRLWRIMSDKELDTLDLPAEVRAEFRRTLFVEPSPFVKRVVFVATPHRGSYRATGLVRKLAARVVSLPGNIARAISASARDGDGLPPRLRNRLPTSLDGMSPDSPFLLALADLPPVAGVTSHSIIAVKDPCHLASGNDGVVRYQSAHVDYVASEAVVTSAHSCQSEPASIEEVRRILLDHLAALDGGRP